MASTLPPDSTLGPLENAHPHRAFRRWWKRLSPARQDRVATFGPLLSVLLFLAAIISAFWYLRNEEQERELESVKRDTEVAQQQVRLRLIENQEQLVRMARELVTKAIDQDEFQGQTVSFVRERPEVVSLSWIGADQKVRMRQLSPNHPGDLLRLTEPPVQPLVGPPEPPAPSMPPSGEPAWAFAAARDLRQPVYSRPFEGGGALSVFQVQVPLIDRSAFAGTLVAEYSVESLLRYFVPSEVTRRHAVSLVDGNDRVLASSVSREPDHASRRNTFAFDVPLAPSGNGIVVRGEGWRTSIGLIGNTLFWMVVALSALTVWMLLGSWRHMRRQIGRAHV